MPQAWKLAKRQPLLSAGKSHLENEDLVTTPDANAHARLHRIPEFKPSGLGEVGHVRL